MNYRLFLLCNVAGAFLWATCVTALGYFLGSRFPIIQHYITPIVILIVVLTMIPVITEIWKANRSDNA